MNSVFQFSTVEQLVRIALMAGGTWTLGAGAAESQDFQTGIGAVSAVIGFGWWAYREWKTKQAAKDVVVVPVSQG